jgi:hypothetical protein
MKALSIKQPWASLIIEGTKKIENRTWKTNYRGRILVHASKNWDKEADIRPNGFDFGCILGEVDIVDCVTFHKSVWFEGPYGFVLENPFEYERPIPYKGQLGLFEVEL